MKYYYHWIMMHYHGWRKRRLIAKFRKAGEKAGLPSLKDFSDDAIVEGLVRLKNLEQLAVSLQEEGEDW